MVQHIPWKKTVLQIFAVVIITAVVVSVSVSAVAAVPNPPHEVFGIVEDQDENAVAGLTVEVTVDDTVVDTGTTNSDGYYEIKVSNDDLEDGDPLTIHAGNKSESVTYSPGASERFDFTVTAVPTTTTATTTTNGSGGGGGGGGIIMPTTTTTSMDDGDEGDATSEPPETVDESTSVVTTTPVPTTESPTTTDTVTDTSTVGTATTDGGGGDIPGFGLETTVLAVIATALLAIRRSN